jgi:hypothetical protein
MQSESEVRLLIKQALEEHDALEPFPERRLGKRVQPMFWHGRLAKVNVYRYNKATAQPGRDTSEETFSP